MKGPVALWRKLLRSPAPRPTRIYVVGRTMRDAVYEARELGIEEPPTVFLSIEQLPARLRGLGTEVTVYVTRCAQEGLHLRPDARAVLEWRTQALDRGVVVWL